MKRKTCRSIFTWAIVMAVFLLQVKRGLTPMAEPFVAVVSGVMASFCAWAVLQLLFFACGRFRGK
ncbi:hypothetical protein KQI82_12780 [Oscillibacter sp. MSJ-2]|uniref:Uncharacterized protein n=1 Tax=Dysosmobacter acutus TaxID=2841504 RepID=A0ABS6FCK5_9FIRM|nr:hypothetical protein [Dysosmobacter acutus]MBU5627785.1 hypothetical protein [Dysosmobacter acutus]